MAEEIVVAEQVERGLIVGGGWLDVVHDGSVGGGDVVSLKRVEGLAVEVLDGVGVDILIDGDSEIDRHVDGEAVGIGVDGVERAAADRIHDVGHLDGAGKSDRRHGNNVEAEHGRGELGDELGVDGVAPVDNGGEVLDEVERDDVVGKDGHHRRWGR